MNILVVDSQQILHPKLQTSARNRLFYSLIRFEHRINGATMHFSADEKSGRVKCAIRASVEGVGIVSVRRAGDSAEEVINLAVDAIEPIIAYRVDWRAIFNVEMLATWLTSISGSIGWLFGRQRYRTAETHHTSPVLVEHRRHDKAANLLRGPHIRTKTNQQANSFSN